MSAQKIMFQHLCGTHGTSWCCFCFSVQPQNFLVLNDPVAVGMHLGIPLKEAGDGSKESFYFSFPAENPQDKEGTLKTPRFC